MSRISKLSTADAAVLANVSPGAFHAWAKRRGLKPIGKARVGRSTKNLWDGDAVLDATRTRPDYSQETK